MGWFQVVELLFALCCFTIVVGGVGFLIWYGVCYSSTESIRREIQREYKEWERRQNEQGR